jgi:hypothetical protein
VPWRGVVSGHERDTACPETQGWDRRIALSGWPIQPWSQRTGASMRSRAYGTGPPCLRARLGPLGPHPIGTERYAAVTSGTSFAQVVGVILGNRTGCRTPIRMSYELSTGVESSSVGWDQRASATMPRSSGWWDLLVAADPLVQLGRRPRPRRERMQVEGDKHRVGPAAGRPAGRCAGGLRRWPAGGRLRDCGPAFPGHGG